MTINLGVGEVAVGFSMDCISAHRAIRTGVLHPDGSISVGGVRPAPGMCGEPLTRAFQTGGPEWKDQEIYSHPGKLLAILADDTRLYQAQTNEAEVYTNDGKRYDCVLCAALERTPNPSVTVAKKWKRQHVGNGVMHVVPV